jgi:thiamine-monophosphate kinase
MRVAEIGEFGLIAKLAALINKKSDKNTPSRRHLLIGIGDDTAAWKVRSGIELITTDVMVEGIHFDFSYTSWRDLGWKSIAINISDVYAMGGRPKYALVSLSLPGHHDVNNILQMYQGMMDICNAYGITLAGGNVSSAEKVAVNVTLTGTTSKDMTTRSAAKPGDLIAVFGYPGLSAAGLRTLKGEAPVSAGALTLLRKAHLRPAPLLDSGPNLAACGVKAAIDTSDGLLSDLGHICEASHVSAVIYAQNLPLHPLLKRYFKHDNLELALTGGEDYRLLFTAGCETMDSVQEKFDPAPAVIGEIVDGQLGRIRVLDAHGKEFKFSHKGWDHYKRPDANG